MIIILVFLLISSVHATEVNDTMARVEELLHKHRGFEALQVLASYKPEEKEVYRYHRLYADAAEMTGKLYEAIKHLRLAYIYAPEEEKEKLLLYRGRMYLRMKHYPEAMTTFRLFLKLYPDSAFRQEAYYYLAEALIKSGLFTEALKYYEKAGDSIKALYGKANALQAIGMTKEAYKLYLSLLEKDSDFLKNSPETRFYLGENLRLMGRLEDARLYLTSVRESPLRYRAYISLGLIALKKKRYREAIKDLQLSLQSPERDVRRKALLLLAETYIKMGKKKEAKKKLITIKNSYPFGEDYDRASLLLARIYREEGDFLRAKRLLKDLVFRLKPYEGAMEELKELILQAKETKQEEFIKLWREMGRLFMSTSYERFLLQVVVDLKNTGKPYYDLCRWLFENGNKKARRQAALLLAEFYSEIGKAELALRFLRMADRRNDKYRRLLIRSYILEGNYRKALRVFKGLKKIKSEDISELLLIAMKEKEAVEILRNALKRVKPPAETYVKIADLLYKKNYKTEALKYYRLALSEEAKASVSNRDLEWAFYRVSYLSNRIVSENTDSIKDPMIKKMLLVYRQEKRVSETMERIFNGFSFTK